VSVKCHGIAVVICAVSVHSLVSDRVSSQVALVLSL
jgi:hypothetical protein